jgi:hypothetical protein
VLSASLPSAIHDGLVSGGVPEQAAARAAHIPPTGALFASFLGYNPMQSLIPPTVLSQLSQSSQDHLLSTGYFPTIIKDPLMQALSTVFLFSALLTLLAALCSWLRGKRFVYEEAEAREVSEVEHQPVLSAQAAK